MRFVRRNAIVAVGNGRNPRDIPLLIGFLDDQDALLRGHAAWALGRIGTDAARTALIEAADREGDREVLDEITRARAVIGSC